MIIPPLTVLHSHLHAVRADDPTVRVDAGGAHHGSNTHVLLHCRLGRHGHFSGAHIVPHNLPLLPHWNHAREIILRETDSLVRAGGFFIFFNVSFPSEIILSTLSAQAVLYVQGRIEGRKPAESVPSCPSKQRSTTAKALRTTDIVLVALRTPAILNAERRIEGGKPTLEVSSISKRTKTRPANVILITLREEAILTLRSAYHGW